MRLSSIHFLVLIAAFFPVSCAGQQQTIATPTSTVATPTADAGQMPTAQTQIGSYNDTNNFRAFAAQIEAAIRARDVKFFIDNTVFENVIAQMLQGRPVDPGLAQDSQQEPLCQPF